MKHMLQRVIGVFLSAVLGMCAPLPVAASDIGNDFERLIQYGEAAGGGQQEKESGGEQDEGKPQKEQSEGKPQEGQDQGEPQGEQDEGKPQGQQVEGKLKGEQVEGKPQGQQVEGKQQKEEGKKKQQEEKSGKKAMVSAPSAILMETSTGQIIYEKDADAKRPPASVTKVMTLLLIFDALNEGKIKLEDEVTTSEYAASMGGSQVFLEPGETQTVDTMIKCISVASANDACVAFHNGRHRKQLYL